MKEKIFEIAEREYVGTLDGIQYNYCQPWRIEREVLNRYTAEEFIEEKLERCVQRGLEEELRSPTLGYGPEVCIKAAKEIRGSDVSDLDEAVDICKEYITEEYTALMKEWWERACTMLYGRYDELFSYKGHRIIPDEH